MACLLNMLGQASAPPARVPTDSIIPVFARDDTTAKRNMSLDFTMLFEHRLDADKLRSAMWKLLERPGWRKLGARLRLNASGKLEYHVPAQYNQDRPPINYTHQLKNMRLAEHKISARIPRANGSAQVFNNLDEFRDLLAGDNPQVLADWIYTDKPQLTLHIVNFTDATFVTIVWLHTLLDGAGLHELIAAWLAVLEGRDEDVPEFIGYDSDPLATIGSPLEETLNTEHGPNRAEFVLKDDLIQGMGKLRFMFNYLWEPFWYPTERGCIIALPSSHFARLKAEAFEELKTLPSNKLTFSTQKTSGSAPQPFLSDGDIITAWFMRIYTCCNKNIANSSPSRLMSAHNVLDMRSVLRSTSPRLLPPAKDGVLTNNCLMNIQSLFTVHEMLSLPLGHIAARIRKDLATQAAREQIEASVRLERENEGFLLCGSGDMAMAVISNLTPAKFYELDFSAAIMEEHSSPIHGVADPPRGKPAYIHIRPTQGGGAAIRGSAICLGKDSAGNWWFYPTMREEWVQNLSEILNADAAKVSGRNHARGTGSDSPIRRSSRL